MGDRANIVLKGKSTFPAPVYLYTHWGGTEIENTLARALDKGRERWNDPQFLGRVIFQEMIGGDNSGTGFGVSTVPCDNEYPFLVVDTDKQTVCREADTREHFNILPKKEADLKPVSYEEFIKRHL